MCTLNEDNNDAIEEYTEATVKTLRITQRSSILIQFPCIIISDLFSCLSNISEYFF